MTAAPIKIKKTARDIQTNRAKSVRLATLALLVVSATVL
jgi:hypothetical protein